MSATGSKQIAFTAFIFIFSTLWILPSWAQYTEETVNRLLHPPKTYVVYKTQENIEIDGKPDEQAWQNAAWTDYFVDIEGDIKPTPWYNTRIKMLWDEQFLYIYAHLEEPHVWATLDQHDAIIFHDNDFEVFIKNTESAPSYYEIEINPLGTIFDLFMPNTYRVGGSALTSWDVNGLQKAVHISGTLNDPTDVDHFWAVEMAIPFTSISYFGQRPVPSSEDVWRINFSRVQWEHEIVNGQYQRKLNEQGRPLPENNWVWSPQGLINMHYPERWGYIRFDDRSPTHVSTTTFNIPEGESVKQKAWLVFYLQRLHQQQHDNYTTDKSNLARLYQGWDDIFKDVRLELSGGNDWFLAKVQTKDGLCFSINQLGHIQRSKLDD